MGLRRGSILLGKGGSAGDVGGRVEVIYRWDGVEAYIRDEHVVHRTPEIRGFGSLVISGGSG